MNKKKTIDLWTEGYHVQEGLCPARFCGTFECDTLKEAIIMYKETLTDPYSISCIDVEDESFWGCKFFDNEADARKSFG